jgi:hypothetical protein
MTDYLGDSWILLLHFKNAPKPNFSNCQKIQKPICPFAIF